MPGLARSGRPSERPRLPCASSSRMSVRLPARASARPRFNEMVVFPTPPFWLAMAMTCMTLRCAPDDKPGPRTPSVAGEGRRSKRSDERDALHQLPAQVRARAPRPLDGEPCAEDVGRALLVAQDEVAHAQHLMVRRLLVDAHEL